MVTVSDIHTISLGRYEVDSSGDFTPDMFSAFLAAANARVLLDAPGLVGVLKERAAGLLVCHQIETGYGRTHLKSYSSGQSNTAMDDAGSSWMKEYREIVQSYREGAERTVMKTKTTLTGCTHTDSTTRGI